MAHPPIRPTAPSIYNCLKSVAENGTLSTDEDTSVTGNLVASDADGDSLTFSIVTNGAKGTATITDSATGEFVYEPNENEFGEDSFSFIANDGTQDSTEATVSITIDPSSLILFTLPLSCVYDY